MAECSCGGTGKVRYEIPADPTPRRVGAVLVTQGGGSGTRQCKCVRDLPPIEGEATWWDTEVIYEGVVVIPIHNEAVEVGADVEVPCRDDGRRVHRTIDNFYYPALIQVESPSSLTLHADTARELAAALIAAAEACEKADRDPTEPGVPA